VFVDHVSSIIRQIFFFVIPAALLIFLLRAQIIRLILGTGEFGWVETRLTAASLGIFCISIIVGSLIPVLAKVFFACHDTKTPALIGVGAVVLNVVLALTFVQMLQGTNMFHDFWVYFLKLGSLDRIEVIGLPLALSLTGVAQLGFLALFLHRRIGDFNVYEIMVSLRKVIIATLVMVAAIYLTLQVVAGLVNMQTFWGVLVQAAAASVAAVLVYGAVAFLVRSPELKTVHHALVRQFTKK